MSAFHTFQNNSLPLLLPDLLHVCMKDKAKYEAELKFTNLNVEDFFRGNKTSEILDIFKERLWKESSDVYMTRIAAPTDFGGRFPVDPKDKEG